MEDNANILKELQHLEVQPPGELYSAIWNTVSRENYTNTYSPPNDPELPAEPEIINKDIPIQFTQLKDYIDNDVQPPDFEKVFQATETKPVSNKTISLLHGWKRIAAILIVVLTATILIIVYNSKGNKGNDSMANHLINKSNHTDSAGLNDPMKQHSNDRKKVNTTDIELAGRNATHISKNVKTAFADGDFIYLLTSFDPETAALFMKDLAGKSVVYLNRFSYVNISDKMKEFLETMYKTKNNKKPTRKARKAKQKLEKWKQADENYFDNSAGKNPLDIIDLSEFLIK